MKHRCLAHIINLATQAVISAHSKSRYYNGNPEDDHLPEDVNGTERDEIGIVHAICVKVCSFDFIVTCLYFWHESIKGALLSSA